MDFCGQQVSGLATGIWENLGSPTNVSAQYITAWLTQSGNISRLNNALGLCVYTSGSENCLVGMDDDALAIYSQLYQLQYYQGSQTSLLTSVVVAGAGSSVTTWTEVREADSTVRREGPSAFLRVYTQMIKDLNAQLRLSIGDYKRNHTSPASVDMASLASYPTP